MLSDVVIDFDSLMPQPRPMVPHSPLLDRGWRQATPSEHLLLARRLGNIFERQIAHMESVRAVKPWAVFRVTDAGVVELDTGDVIQ